MGHSLPIDLGHPNTNAAFLQALSSSSSQMGTESTEEQVIDDRARSGVKAKRCDESALIQYVSFCRLGF